MLSTLFHSYKKRHNGYVVKKKLNPTKDVALTNVTSPGEH